MKKYLAPLVVATILLISLNVFAEDVNYGEQLKAWGIIKGDQNGNLNEANKLTREEAIVTLTRMMGRAEDAKQCKGEMSFNDVPDDHWAAPYLCFAKEQDWTKGVGDGRFGLGQNLTTQQYLTFMLRALGYTGADVYANAMQMAYELDLLNDVKATDAGAVITRGDVFIIIYNTLYAETEGADRALVYQLGLVEREPSIYPLSIRTYTHAKDERNITYEAAPQRVFAVYQDAIEIMLALGLEENIVACAGIDQVVKPSYAASFDKLDYIAEQFSPDRETVLSYKPDMILSWWSYFSDSKIGDVDFWQARDVGVYIMQNSVADMDKKLSNELSDILTIGRIFNVEEKAEEIVNAITVELARIIDITSAIEPRPTVAILEVDENGVRDYGEETLAGDMVRSLGAELVTAPNDRIVMTRQELMTADPDVVFVVYLGDSNSRKDVEIAVNKLAGDPKYKSLSAVKNNRVHAISLNEIYCSGMRTLDGITKLAKAIYPGHIK